MDPTRLADQGTLVRFAVPLSTLGRQHGLSNFHLAGEGRLIADIAPGFTYMDVARFEIAAEDIVQGARVEVLLSGTPLADQFRRGPLLTTTTE